MAARINNTRRVSTPPPPPATTSHVESIRWTRVVMDGLLRLGGVPIRHIIGHRHPTEFLS